MMEDETVEEFKAKLKKLNDDVIDFKPTQKLKESYQKQRPKVISSLQSRANSGWRRGLTLDGSVR